MNIVKHFNAHFYLLHQLINVNFSVSPAIKGANDDINKILDEKREKGKASDVVDNTSQTMPQIHKIAKPAFSNNAMQGDSDNRWGSTGRSTIFDPFKRSASIPFGLYGRRRSICVMTTIPETPETVKTSNDQENI